MLIKATPPLSTPGLLLIGASRVNFSRYILVSIVTTIPIKVVRELNIKHGDFIKISIEKTNM